MPSMLDRLAGLASRPLTHHRRRHRRPMLSPGGGKTPCGTR